MPDGGVLCSVVKPAAQRPGAFEAYVGGEYLLTSRQPLADAARALVARGIDPATPITLRHADKPYDSFVPAPLWVWAAKTYTEGERTPLRAQVWMPIPDVRHPRRKAP